ncbi:MAG: CRISPR-associated protein Csx19 [Coriobacteriia bacterium]|nr:CRISPR-associated protein Csx19 [Coriobacteriia bacterium]
MSDGKKGLNKFYFIDSTVIDIPTDIDEILNTIYSCKYVVLYKLDGVELIDADTISKIPNELLELRAFDDEKEIHIVNVTPPGSSEHAPIYYGRVRYDNEANELFGSKHQSVFDEEHILWGNPSRENNFIESTTRILLRGDRGNKIDVPNISGGIIPYQRNNKLNSYITVLVRNYLNDLDDNFKFVDYRFVQLENRRVYEYE